MPGPAMGTGPEAMGQPKNKSPDSLQGMALYMQQAKALLIKNFLVSRRHRFATLLQLLSGFIFVVLLVLVEVWIQPFLEDPETSKNVPQPPINTVNSIPRCHDSYYMREECFDFIWSGRHSDVIVSLVKNISANNPGRPINFETQTLGFNTSEDVDAWLRANPHMTTGALLFSFDQNNNIGYAVQTNSTYGARRVTWDDPTFTFQVPLQVAAEREIARHITKQWHMTWNPSYAMFAHPARFQYSIPNVAAVFLLAAACFNFVLQTSNIVVEKELRLRQTMSIMGLNDLVYWFTWVIWEVMMGIISNLVLVSFGTIFQIKFFTHNSFFVVYLLLLLFWMSMTALAFLVSTFLHKSSSAASIGFLLFICGSCLQALIAFDIPFAKEFAGFPFSAKSPGFLRVLFSFFPPSLLALGLRYLQESVYFSGSAGLDLTNISMCPFWRNPCIYTMAEILGWLVGDFCVFFVLALYLDKVLPDINGVKQPLLFFLEPFFKKQEPLSADAIAAEEKRAASFIGTSCTLPSSFSFSSKFMTRTISSSFPLQSIPGKCDSGLDEGLDIDVEEEKWRIRQALANEGTGDVGSLGALGSLKLDTDRMDEVALSVQGLEKVFPGKWTFKGGIKKKAPYHALKGPWLEVQKNSLLCLLGPNGAGKSTLINILTGSLPASSGDAFIYGSSFRSMESRKSVGICPQFDVLWDRLTGIEHLFLFARIKGLPMSYIEEEANVLLEEVRLQGSRNVVAGSYSGGMRRRLSVAVALIGNPSMVFLDEPTTGMDPVSRRCVWDIIERAKKDRAIVLTAHSMEEADILGDRIAIMAKGQLRCIGTSIRLKQRFGNGFIVSLGLTRMEQQEKAQRLQLQALASAGQNKEAEGQNKEPEGEITGASGQNKDGETEDSETVMLTQIGSTVDQIRRDSLKEFFQLKLQIEPVEESRECMRFCIPRREGREGRGGRGGREGRGLSPAGGQCTAEALELTWGSGAKNLDSASLLARAKSGAAPIPMSRHALTRNGSASPDLNLADFFRELGRRKSEFGIEHMQISLTTLEEVFLRVVQKAELEASIAEGRFETLVLASGLTVKVPIGAEVICLPSGDSTSDSEEGPCSPVLIYLEWQQDEDGALRIVNHSDPLPVMDSFTKEMALNELAFSIPEEPAKEKEAPTPDTMSPKKALTPLVVLRHAALAQWNRSIRTD